MSTEAAFVQKIRETGEKVLKLTATLVYKYHTVTERKKSVLIFLVLIYFKAYFSK